MDYSAHYFRLVERARHRVLDGYSEKHHILPRCLGGSDEAENIVRLTPEEHYVAHQLLVKMYPGNHKLLWAAVSMTNQTGRMSRSNKLYGWLRRKFVDELRKRATGRLHTDKAKAKMSASRLGAKRKPHSAETKAKMSAAAKGRPRSEAHCKALSLAKTGIERGPHKPETIEKIRRANIEHAKTADYSGRRRDEYRNGQAEKMKEVWADRKAGLAPMPNLVSKE